MARAQGEKADEGLKKLGTDVGEELKKIGKNIDKGVKKLAEETDKGIKKLRKQIQFLLITVQSTSLYDIRVVRVKAILIIIML